MEDDLDLAAALGADDEGSVQVLSVYVPSKDSNGREFDPTRWRAEALRLLSDVGGGATAMPSAEGAWLNLPRLREFLHRMGRETGQGEVVCEFDRVLYRIRSFDPRR